MRRRAFLTASAVVTVPAIAGCLGNDDGDDGDNGNGDNDNRDNGNGDNDNGDNGNGDNGNGDTGTETIAYEELSDEGQSFVDAAAETHRVVWIAEDGERVAVEYEDDEWVTVPDPLAPEFLSEDIQALVEGDVHLEMDGETYRVIHSTGHEPYGEDYELEATDDCDGEHRLPESFEMLQQGLLETLIEEGSLAIAHAGYEQVSTADTFIDRDRPLRSFLAETFVAGETCLEDGDATYRVVVDEEFLRYPEEYMLESIEG